MTLNSKKVTVFILAGFAVLSSACHTVEGIGKDLESAGDKAEEITKKK